MAGDKSSIKELVVDHQFLNGLHRFNNVDINVTVGELFPSLTQLTFATCHTVSPGDIERLAHSSLAVLSIEHGETVKGRKLVPLIGEPASLGQLFSSSFPQLTCLTFQELIIGNIRSEAILHNLKNHLHLKSVSIIGCFTDDEDELDTLAEQITTENRMEITLQHHTAQRTLLLNFLTGPLTIGVIDALCHRTCVNYLQLFEVEIADEECFPDFHGREVDSKIQTVRVDFGWTNDLLVQRQSAFKQLAKFLCSLPCLTTLEIKVDVYLIDDFFTELASSAASSQIQTIVLHCQRHPMATRALSNLASKQLGKFLCSLPRLTTLTIRGDERSYDDFYTQLESLAASSQNPYFMEKVHISMIQDISVKIPHPLRQQQRQRWLEQQSRTDAAPVESERIPEHRKAFTATNDGDRVDESLEQHPEKRRAKKKCPCNLM